jgi:hypothetical protein
MKTSIFLSLFFIGFSASIYAQDQDSTKTPKQGKFNKAVDKVVDKAKQIPDMLVPNAPVLTDSMLSVLRNDNLVMTIDPKWTEAGTQIGNDMKIQKVNEEPLDATFPLPDKKIANGLIITMATQKKTPEDKKNLLFAQVKADLAKYYKDAGKTVSGEELSTQAKAFIKGPETFTTTEGKQGELYYINDIQPQQTNFIIALLIPGTKPGTVILNQFLYLKYTYDSNIPDDMQDLRLFTYPDDEKTYVDFTKKMMKTFKTQ